MNIIYKIDDHSPDNQCSDKFLSSKSPCVRNTHYTHGRFFSNSGRWLTLKNIAASSLRNSSILNFPAVTIRQAHEKPGGMDEGTLIPCDLEKERVLEAIVVVRSHFVEGMCQFRIVDDYDVENVLKKVLKKVLRIILSYTDYTNKTGLA